MRRREFIAGIAGGAAWSVVARAQQPERLRRVAVLVAFGEIDPEGREQLASFKRGLTELGWMDGRNLRMEVRWGAGSIDRVRILAKELVDLQPDVILASGTAVTNALRQQTQTLPIVFTLVGDPVGDGFVASLARPGGNVTGFPSQEAGMAGKWLQLLMEIAPRINRVAMMFNPDTAAGGGSYFLPPFEAAARSLKVVPIAASVRSDAEIETTFTSIGHAQGGGLIIMPEAFAFIHRERVISLAAQNKVPTVFPISVYARDGGLLSYGPDYKDIFYRAARYVDRILGGAKPADLPVQVPVKFDMAVNMRTAKALGLTVPPSILLRADEVIE